MKSPTKLASKLILCGAVVVIITWVDGPPLRFL
jgi:hypothetical protein